MRKKCKTQAYLDCFNNAECSFDNGSAECRMHVMFEMPTPMFGVFVEKVAGRFLLLLLLPVLDKSSCDEIGFPLADRAERSRLIAREEFLRSSHLCIHCIRISEIQNEAQMSNLLWCRPRYESCYSFPHLWIVWLEVWRIHEGSEH